MRVHRHAGGPQRLHCGPVLIDSHCHLDCDAFDLDRAAVLTRARSAEVRGFVLAGVDPSSWTRQRALAATEKGMRWSAGLHPTEVARLGAGYVARALAALGECFVGPTPASALGETGLDARFAPRETLPAQAAAFREQLALARSLDVPVVLHIVGDGAHGRALECLRADGLPRRGGVVHAYSGSAELVQAYVALGLHLSFAGSAARPGNLKSPAAARCVPAERLLVETDAPDLSPPGLPARNEPSALPTVLAFLAAARGETVEELGSATSRNAAHLFGEFE